MTFGCRVYRAGFRVENGGVCSTTESGPFHGGFTQSHNGAHLCFDVYVCVYIYTHIHIQVYLKSVYAYEGVHRCVYAFLASRLRVLESSF